MRHSRTAASKTSGWLPTAGIYNSTSLAISITVSILPTALTIFSVIFTFPSMSLIYDTSTSFD